jgi:hypothetical protein
MIDLFQEYERKKIAAFIKNEKDRLSYNEKIQDILDGAIQGLLDARMKEDLGIKSYMGAATRKSPINVFRKIIDKLTRIYEQPVIRTVENGTDSDRELMEWYERKLNLNRKMGKNNFKFNAFYYALIQIGLKDRPLAAGEDARIRQPFVRTIPNHQFLVMNASRVDNSSPDVIILCMDKRKLANGTEQQVYYVYTDLQFIIMDQGGSIIADLMAENDLDGFNPYQVTPFAYSNESDDAAMPAVQTDNLDLALLIPLLLTDLNYAVKFQAFSVFVAINLDDKQVELSPNSIISFQTPPGEGDNKASFDVIKPTIDITQTLSLASSQMALWLSTKGVRPGQIAQIGTDQLASGISKMIDESDTFESIKKQITVYEQTEAEFWEKLLHHIHPAWVAAGVVENKTIFSAEARVVTKFTPPVPMQTRGEKIVELSTEMDAGLTSRKRAIKMLNTGLTDQEIEELLEEIDEETPVIAAPPPITEPNEDEENEEP